MTQPDLETLTHTLAETHKTHTHLQTQTYTDTHTFAEIDRQTQTHRRKT